MQGRLCILTGLITSCGLPLGGCRNVLTPQAHELLTSSSIAFRAGDYPTTIVRTDAFLKDYGRSSAADEAYYLRGLAKYQLSDRAGARVDLEQALDRTRLPLVRMNASNALGDLAWEDGDLATAERMYRQALANGPENQPPADHAQYRLGCILQRNSAWEEADAMLDRVIHYFGDTKIGKLAARRVRSRAWTVQAGAYKQKALAETAAGQLRAAGLEPLVQSGLEDGQLRFVVQVGRYGTYAEAEASLASVSKHTSDAFITTTR